MSLVREAQLPILVAAGGAAAVLGAAVRRRSWSTWLVGIALLVLALAAAWVARPLAGVAS